MVHLAGTLPSQGSSSYSDAKLLLDVHGATDVGEADVGEADVGDAVVGDADSVVAASRLELVCAADGANITAATASTATQRLQLAGRMACRVECKLIL